MAENDRRDPVDRRPLRPVEFQILVLLADGAKHGWAILQRAEDGGRAVPGIATLYRTLQRLETDALIERRRDLEDDEDRRRVYDLTPAGRAAASAEARRLDTLLGVARSARLLDEPDAG
ncbi:MAG: helix-turn-helix transcriptional regulator [Gemmatimonadota bacterium]|nr:helix-turn-helix transcriptional regulator [Gemmatimonadota bacterium]